MFSSQRAKRRTATALAALAMVTLSGTLAFADAALKDAKPGTYYQWGADKVKIRLDKIERVEHVDGRPFGQWQDLKNAANGYTILNFSVQDAGPADQVRDAGIDIVFDDESEIDGHTYGPFVGAGTAYFSHHLEHLQTTHIKYVQINTPADRKITKIILDPQDGGPKLRYQVKDDTIARLTEVPLPADK